MNTMHRQFGRLMSKGEGQNTKVSVLLNDYEAADKTLTKASYAIHPLLLCHLNNAKKQIIDASKTWRDAWVSILSMQLGTISAFEELYEPIIGTSDGHRDEPILTDGAVMERTVKLKETYSELKTDLLEEVMMMDARVIRPATDAKEYLQPLKKNIKKRENKRLDWERYIDRVNHASKKLKRTDRENAALAKAEADLAAAADAFKVADDHLRETLPPLISAVFSILPHLLAVQIMIQNALLAQYYTSLHNYAEEVGFPSPPPPMKDVIATWNHDFKPVQLEAERINCIARGKAVHQSMALGDDGIKRAPTSLEVRSAFGTRRVSSYHVNTDAPVSTPDARIMRIPSSNSTLSVSHRERSQSPEPRLTPATSRSHSPAGPGGDYAQRSAVQKKKPPPPPPPKRINSTALFAVALYPFQGEGDGDLSFSEGDRIKVVKKTDSTDDWWQGELRGVKGSFPANYCKLA